MTAQIINLADRREEIRTRRVFNPWGLAVYAGIAGSITFWFYIGVVVASFARLP
jgi:hypothetical protein